MLTVALDTMMRFRAGFVTVPALNRVGVHGGRLAKATHEGDNSQAPYARVLKQARHVIHDRQSKRMLILK